MLRHVYSRLFVDKVAMKMFSKIKVVNLVVLNYKTPEAEMF